jgi:hypothetical protein
MLANPVRAWWLRSIQATGRPALRGFKEYGPDDCVRLVEQIAQGDEDASVELYLAVQGLKGSPPIRPMGVTKNPANGERRKSGSQRPLRESYQCPDPHLGYVRIGPKKPFEPPPLGTRSALNSG